VRPAVPNSFLIIQTAFPGDVILATALIEKLHQKFPAASIDFLVRQGNESLLAGHPLLRNVLVWDKKKGKIKNLIAVIRQIRSLRYDVVINVQRFTSSGVITVLSKAKYTIGFGKNPLSLFFSNRVVHDIGNGLHETERNQKLVEELTDAHASKPRLYPAPTDFENVAAYVTAAATSRIYFCMAPASVWFTKQFPKEKWISLIDQSALRLYPVFLIGSPQDQPLGEFIRAGVQHPNVINLCGKLSYLESAALMQGAVMNFVNDSAPMHLASAMNAPVTAIYCSTIPAFGFGPLSDVKRIIETEVKLSCKPCGLHGHKVCPEGHFKCALTIEETAILNF
jgi:heptosyltransferase II